MTSFINILLLILLLHPAIQENKVEVCLSAEEKKLFNMINEYRKSKKLAAIPYSARLTLVAQSHAQDLAEHYNFDINNRCNPHSWSEEGDWTACCYTNDHAQAACMWNKPREIAGYEGDGYEIAYYSSAGATAAQGLTGWQKSAAHNPLLINSGMWKQIEWKAMGVALYREYGVVWFGREPDDQTNVTICD